MNAKKSFSVKENKRLVGILITVTLILLVPLIAMLFTSEVQWTLSDFVVAGILLFGSGLLCELVMRKVKKTKHRIVICAVIIALLLIIWGELAVGLFNTPLSGN